MTPKEVLREWIDCFNVADAARIVELYADDAVNHQVANEPIAGKAALYEMFANEFAAAEIVCIVEISSKGHIGMERSSRTSRMRFFPCEER